MLIFDRIRLQDIDRRNWQLWILAIVMILILAGGLALHMYTLAWATGFSVSQRTMLKGMIGFCVLAILFVGYLLDRQAVITRLRKDLADEKKLSRSTARPATPRSRPRAAAAPPRARDPPIPATGRRKARRA